MNAPASKTYSLKPAEIQLLKTIIQQMNVILSNTISVFAIERLAYNVTERTQFNFNEDFTEVTISELPEETGIVTEPPKKEKK